jgi:hypothetical protein
MTGGVPPGPVLGTGGNRARRRGNGGRGADWVAPEGGGPGDGPGKGPRLRGPGGETAGQLVEAPQREPTVGKRGSAKDWLGKARGYNPEATGWGKR